MNHSEQKPAGSNASDYSASAFTQELLDELAREHYRPHAWRRFMSRSWSRSLDDIRESSARARSFWTWAGGVAATEPTVIGRATTFATSVLLLVIAFKLLLSTNWPPSSWIEWSLQFLYLLIATNILYLFYCGFAWADLGRNHS